MTWTRLDDNWSDKIRTLDLGFQTRWHYLSMIQFCSRTSKRDGALKAADARACSDVDDPIACLNELIEHGLVTRHVTGDVTRYVVVNVLAYLPKDDDKSSPSARSARYRAHKAGDHHLCLIGHCPDAPPEGSLRDCDVTPGTGQDGPGLEELPAHSGSKIPSQTGPHADPPCGVDPATGVVTEGPYAPCKKCGSTWDDCTNCWDDPEVVEVCKACSGRGCIDCDDTARLAWGLGPLR